MEILHVTNKIKIYDKKSKLKKLYTLNFNLSTLFYLINYILVKLLQMHEINNFRHLVQGWYIKMRIEDLVCY